MDPVIKHMHHLAVANLVWGFDKKKKKRRNPMLLIVFLSCCRNTNGGTQTNSSSVYRYDLWPATPPEGSDTATNFCLLYVCKILWAAVFRMCSVSY